MKNLAEFNSSFEFLLTDIDDTLTDDGLLGPEAYSALWSLYSAGIKIIPVTGRPAGWCELIARQWPVVGVVGENGGFYFNYNRQIKKMKRYFIFNEKVQIENQNKLEKIKIEILQQVPGSALASDQFSRLMDLAIDFCEDVPRLPEKEVDKIVAIFQKHGAQAKVSSIHVNGWFGDYSKVTTSLYFLLKEFNLDSASAKQRCAFVGDSPNDEPMFQIFPHSFGVANIKNFADRLKHKPSYLATKSGGQGFAEISKMILGKISP